MRKEKSWTRRQYEHCFRTMRRETLNSCMASFVGIHNDIINAADYSYQAFGYAVSGWTSRSREKRFYAIKFRIEAARDWLTC